MVDSGWAYSDGRNAEASSQHVTGRHAPADGNDEEHES